MDTARWKGGFCPPATSTGLRVTSIFPSQVALVAIITLTLLTLCLVTEPGQARASGGEKITFTAPIYSGQNGGNPEGPVGAQVTVHGSGWTPNAQVGLSVADKAGDTPGKQGSACNNGKVPLYTAANTRSDGSGKVIAVFLWPDEANKVGHSYWVCASVSGKTIPGTNAYTVLSAQAPSDAISIPQATPGGMITVTGQHWLPGKQTISVTIAPSLTGQPPYSSTAQTTATSGGSFSVAVQVPLAAPPGSTLYVSAQNQGPNANALHTEPTNTPHFTVVAASTPTPTNTPMPSVTSVAKSGSNTGGNGGNGNGQTAGSNGLLLLLIAGLGFLLLLGAGAGVVLSLRPHSPTAGVTGGSKLPYGRQGREYSSPGGGYPPSNPPWRAGPQRNPPSSGSDPDDAGWTSTRPDAGDEDDGWENLEDWQDAPYGPGPDDGSGYDHRGRSDPWC